MFVPIPGFRKNPDAPARSAPSASKDRLGSITLRPSFYLWRAQALVHGLLALCLSFALLPFFPAQPWWVLLWLASIFLLAFSLFVCRRALKLPVRVLSFTAADWLFNDGQAERGVELLGDALVWNGLIILRCRDKLQRHSFNLVILPDSASAEEQRSLRVWLRTRSTR